MKTSLASAAAAVLVTFAIASCGSGTVTIGGGGNGNTKKVTIKGNIRDVSPVTSRDIIVYAYRLPDDDTTDRCPCPPNPSLSTDGKAQLLTSGTTAFSLTGIEAGNIGIVFLLDNAGTNADGTIDPGDPIAILDDLNCRLQDMKVNTTATLTDVDILFDTAPVSNDPDNPDEDCDIGDPPAVGRARARTITVATTSTSGS